MKHLAQSLTLVAFTLAAPVALADTWTLDATHSNLSFGSVKSQVTGETHTFSNLSGSVSNAGVVSVTIDLTSVETNIDIRNERMIEHVFKAAKTAQISAPIDMGAMNGLGVGDSEIMEISGTVNIVGTDVELEADMFVMRLSETSAMVSTNGMVFLDLGSGPINPAALV